VKPNWIFRRSQPWGRGRPQTEPDHLRGGARAHGLRHCRLLSVRRHRIDPHQTASQVSPSNAGPTTSATGRG